MLSLTFLLCVSFLARKTAGPGRKGNAIYSQTWQKNKHLGVRGASASLPLIRERHYMCGQNEGPLWICCSW